MHKITWSAIIGAVAAMLLYCGTELAAADYTIGGREFSLEGYFRQEFAFGVAETSEHKTNQPGLHSAYQTWYLDSNLVVSDQLEVRTIVRLNGDMIYNLRGDHGHFGRYFEHSRDNLQWDNDFNQILRECYLTWSSPKFLVRVGKQQIGWGEADGLRLMDVINSLDLRRGPFYDTQGYEEVRIPKWMLKTEFFPGAFGPFSDSGIELVWNPGDVQETGEILPPFANPQRAGGILVPGQYPTEVQRQWGIWGIPVNFVPFPIRFYKEERSTALKNSEYGSRLKFLWKDTLITLNYWQGFQADCILDFKGLSFDPVNGFVSPFPGMPPFPAILTFDRVFKRMKIAGFTVNRELYGVGCLVGQVANPVLRVEALYEFKKYFNTAEMTPTDMLVPRHYDQIRYMVGFDWPLRLNFLNPGKNTFVSGQMFHLYTLNHKDGQRAPRPAPFYNWTYPKNQFYSSLLIRTEYMNDKVNPSMLLVWDHSTQAAWIKAKTYFQYGDHWRPEIGYLWIKRNTHHTQYPMGPLGPPISDNWKSFGTFEDRDEVYVRIQYQF